MPGRRAKPLSRRGTAFIALVVCGGTLAILLSLRTLVSEAVPPQWLLFAALTLASSMFTLKIPSIQSRLSVSEIFAFTSILLFGPEAAAVTLALDGVLISLRWRMTPLQTAFNFANLGLSVWACGRVFFLVSGAAPLFARSAAYQDLLLPLMLMVVTYFVVNSGLTATAVASERGDHIWLVWRRHFLPLAPNYLAGASVSLLLVVAFQQVHFTALALILPVLLISYLTQRASLGRFEDSQAHVADLNRLLLSTVETLATAIDAKDEVTHSHVRRVQQGTIALARELGVTDEQTLKAIEAGALLHDTGKIAVPEHILNKPGRLTAAEFEKMKRHAPIGAEILSSIDFPYPVVPIVRHHHENWDGTGYPDGLAGTDIPLGARILSVVDCYDALTSDRPYRSRMTDAQAIAILRERRGTMYDPMIVDAFIAAAPRLMPSRTGLRHPAAVAIGGARARDREETGLTHSERTDADPPSFQDGVLAVTSLTRALSGEARLGDVGALIWMLLRQALASNAMTISRIDEATDTVTVRFAAGTHASLLRTIAHPSGGGISGWVAVNLRPAINAEPALELGSKAVPLQPELLSCLSVPLVERDALVAVLSVYSERPRAYSDDDVRLIEVLAPRLASAILRSSNAEETAESTPPSSRQPLRLVKTN